MKNFLRFILLIVLIPSFGCQPQKANVPPSGKIVKIGVIAPMSGIDNTSGKNAIAGIQTALQLKPFLNNGDKLELVVEDNQGNPEKTLSALRKIRMDEDVSAVLLMAESDAVLPLVPFADQYKIPILALVATHPDITKDNHYISQLAFDDIYQGTVAAVYTRDEMLINKVAVFYDPGNAHYSYLQSEFVGKFISLGGEIVEQIPVNPETGDIRAMLENLRKNQVQLLYLAVPPSQVLHIARSVNSIGWHPKMMGSDGLLAAIILRHKDDIGLVNGMMATDIYSNRLPETEYGRKVIKTYRKLFTERPTSFTLLGCEGASILIHAMDRCYDKYNRLCINEMLHNTRGFEGLYGRITIHEDGKAERPIFVNHIVGQEPEFLVKVH